jgi:NhaP-type Na+/H+ or K+/H+ antiporter
LFQKRGFSIPPDMLLEEINEKDELLKPVGNHSGGEKATQKLYSEYLTNQFCPPKGEVADFLTQAITIILIFVATRTILGEEAGVGGSIFALLILIMVALVGGKFIVGFCWLLKKSSKGIIDIKFPPLLGMLLAGILLRNVPYAQDQSESRSGIRELHDKFNYTFEVDHEDTLYKYIGRDVDPQIANNLRLLCLTVILLMAGLELDPVALRKLSGLVIRVTFIPCLAEVGTVAILSKLLLGFTWKVGIMLGFVLAAVSPAVIIPCLMELSQKGYGVEKGIPTLVIAACSFDDVVAISGFGILMGITFHPDKPLWALILHGPIEIIIGVSFGLIAGFVGQWIPNKDAEYVGFFRWLILFCGGLIAIFGSNSIHYDGAGGIATIIMAFVAGLKWRNEGWDEHNPVTKMFRRMWVILEPVIFGLIGTELQVSKISPHTIGLSISILFVAVVIRMTATYLSVSGGCLNRREKIFMAFAWLPKATVQAALGPIFLNNVNSHMMDDLWDTAENKNAWIHDNPGKNDTEWKPIGEKDTWESYGEDILTIAVLSIIITAPLGAVLTMVSGVKCLELNEAHAQNFKRKMKRESS